MRHHRRTRPACPPLTMRRSRPPWALLWMMLIVPMTAMAGEGRSPSRLVPARGLVFYLEYDGLGAHAEAWKATAACEILRQRSASDMITDVARRVLNRLLKIVPDNPMTGDDLIGLQQHIVQHGLALSCFDEKGRTSTVIVLDRVQGGEIPGRLDRLLRLVSQQKGDAGRPAAGPGPGPRAAPARARESGGTPGPWDRDAGPGPIWRIFLEGAGESDRRHPSPGGWKVIR